LLGFLAGLVTYAEILRKDLQILRNYYSANNDRQQ
jgi:hypothetical protein